MTENFVKYRDAVEKVTYNSYEEAYLRAEIIAELPSHPNNEDFNLYSFANVLPILLSTLNLVLRIFWLYILLFLLLCVIIQYGSIVDAAPILTVVAAIALLFFNLYEKKVMSCINGCPGYNSVGASTEPGLYYNHKSRHMSDLVRKCSILSSNEAINGCISHKDLNSCHFLFSGDMRTLFPFLFFTPPHVEYIRRWVRVPLSDGPLDNLGRENINGGEAFEAVALDCSYASGNGNVAYLVLAGLTGGSDEGYIRDFVVSAKSRNCDCFVMLGRGLGGCPCLSDAAFHGARTSDMAAVAKMLRSCLTSDMKLFVVGISLGGIIVINGIARGVLPDVDGAVSISVSIPDDYCNYFSG